MPFQIFGVEARSILSPVSGFLREAGFTHSLTPARNCTFGCSYCYVPTMRVQGGLRPEDWKHWGEWTTFKTNAAALLARSLRPGQIIYCSPLTDPYQPAEEDVKLMPDVLEAVSKGPETVFVIQTRGPGILRDIELLQAISRRTTLRVGFSITTHDEGVRRIFEPHCAPLEERWKTVAMLRDAGIAVTVTIAPILPCEPELLIRRAIDVSAGPIIGDPLHVRAMKRSGATTREAAIAICARHGWSDWLQPDFQQSILSQMGGIARAAAREFAYGPAGFAMLTKALS